MKVPYTCPISWSVPLQASCDELKNEATQVCCSHHDLVKYAINVTRKHTHTHTSFFLPLSPSRKIQAWMCVRCFKKKWHVVGEAQPGQGLEMMSGWKTKPGRRYQGGREARGRENERQDIRGKEFSSLVIAKATNTTQTCSSKIKPCMATRFNLHFVPFYPLLKVILHKPHHKRITLPSKWQCLLPVTTQSPTDLELPARYFSKCTFLF